MRPHIPLLRANNVRTGFFERQQIESVIRNLPAPVAAVVSFCDITGGRIPSEVLTLQWRQVDLAAGIVRLDPGPTKNSEGRVFPMTAALRQLIEQQKAVRDQVKREKSVLCQWVFHRDGEPIRRVHEGMEISLRRRRMPGPYPPRPTTNRCPQSRPRGRSGARGDADDRAQDPLSVRALQHRQRR